MHIKINCLRNLEKLIEMLKRECQGKKVEVSRRTLDVSGILRYDCFEF